MLPIFQTQVRELSQRVLMDYKRLWLEADIDLLNVYIEVYENCLKEMPNNRTFSSRLKAFKKALCYRSSRQA